MFCKEKYGQKVGFQGQNVLTKLLKNMPKLFPFSASKAVFKFPSNTF
jgi:hypothetical protein